MKLRWWKVSLIYAGIVIIAAVLGTALGDLNAARREKTRLVEQQQELQNYLKDNVQGIAVGERFPEFTVWRNDGETTVQSTDLLGGGGILFYLLASCESCLDAVDELYATRNATGNEPVEVALLVSGDPETLLNHMAARGYDLPVYRDTEDRLLKEYRVSAFPCFFKLTPDDVVTDFGAIKTGTGMFAAIFSD